MESFHLIPWDKNFLHFQNWSTNGTLKFYKGFSNLILHENKKESEIKQNTGVESFKVIPWDKNFLNFQNISTNDRVMALWNFYLIQSCVAQVLSYLILHENKKKSEIKHKKLPSDTMRQKLFKIIQPMTELWHFEIFTL